MILLFFLVFTPALKGTETLSEFDRRITTEIERQDPEAARLFREANLARENGEREKAAALYEDVAKRLPNNPHASRRLAGEKLEMGDRAAALELSRQALALDRTPENLVNMANALATGVQRSTPSAAQLDEALTLAREAIAMQPDEFGYLAIAQIALTKDDLDLLSEATGKLKQIAPDSISTHIVDAIFQASNDDFDAAYRALGRAKELGLPDEDYDHYRTSFRNAQPLWKRILQPALWTLGVWAAGLALLFALGLALSHAAMKAASTPPAPARGGRAEGLSATLRRAYTLVLWACGAYYYLSIPVLIATVLAVAGGLLFAIFATGWIPIKIVVIIVVIAGVSLISIVKSLFVRTSDDEPGVRLDLGNNPRLRTLLNEVAMKIGTRPVENVYMTPGTDVAVMERGGMIRKLRGRGERCLILGAGVLDGLRVRPFRAVLGHEYGHFSNRDTAGGTVALIVRQSVTKMAINLAQGGAATKMNPAWLFVIGFHNVFLRVSQGASRLQEVLADRWAAFAYGSASFEEGLRHVIAQSVRFDAHASASLKEVVDTRNGLANLYTYAPKKAPDATEIEAEIDKAFKREPSPFDSHPAPQQRFQWVAAIHARGSAPSADDDAPAWTLFADRDALERLMTDEVRKNVAANYGVAIRATVEQTSQESDT